MLTEVTNLVSMCCCCERALADWDQVFPDGTKMGVCGRCAEVVENVRLVPRQRQC